MALKTEDFYAEGLDHIEMMETATEAIRKENEEYNQIWEDRESENKGLESEPSE